MCSFPLGKYIKHIAASFYKEKPQFDPQLINDIQKMAAQVKERQYRDKYLKAMRFVIFDTETTGFHPYAGDELISIGAVVIENGRIVENRSFHELIYPGRAIPPIVSEITGILDKDVEDAPSALPILHKFLHFIKDYYLVAHCADFDLNFINSKLKRISKTKLYNPTIDTMALAYHLLPSNSSHNLDVLLQEYGIQVEGRHTALGDALMTARLFLHFLDELEQRGIQTLHALESYIKTMHLLRQQESGFA